MESIQSVLYYFLLYVQIHQVGGGDQYLFGQYNANNETFVPWVKDGQTVMAHLEGGKGGPSLLPALYQPHSTLRMRLQAESCRLKLGTPRSWKWPENAMAWRRRTSRCFYPRYLVLKKA